MVLGFGVWVLGFLQASIRVPLEFREGFYGVLSFRVALRVSCVGFRVPLRGLGFRV